MAKFTEEVREFFDIRRLVFRIGELAAMTDVSARQLRYWEKKGLIASEEREDGQQARVYTFKTFVRVSMIKYYLDNGYTLAAAGKLAAERQDRVQYIHRFITRGMRGMAQVDGQMAINLGPFDETQTLMALIPEADTDAVRYKLLSNEEAQRVTQNTPA